MYNMYSIQMYRPPGPVIQIAAVRDFLQSLPANSEQHLHRRFLPRHLICNFRNKPTALQGKTSQKIVQPYFRLRLNASPKTERMSSPL
jgi:hypothetical protein